MTDDQGEDQGASDNTAISESPGAGGGETAVAEPPPDPKTTVVPPVAVSEAPTAWAEADDEPDSPRRPWRLVWGIVAAVLVVCAAVAIVVVNVLHEDHPTSTADPAPAPSPTTYAPSQPVLDGTYRLVFDESRATLSTNEVNTETGTRTSWWAFRSRCVTANLCSAAGVKLDDTYHTVRASGAVITDNTLNWNNGEWAEIPVTAGLRTPVGQCTTESARLEMRMQPDDTLAGVETLTITGGCPDSGKSVMTPFVATRMGSVPDGIFGGRR